ncbi:MAG: co-chaperone GroES [Planctomycetes bacterium]|jgi:chaperonin GroES|nr:co-chaperone GroES [Planctomycetota bacterium]
MAKAAKKSTKKTKVRPLGEKILVKRLEAEEKTKGGIILPEAAKEKPQQGTVMAVGDGKLLKDGSRSTIQVDTGDQIVFNSYAGTDISIDGEDLLLMNETDVLAIVE